MVALHLPLSLIIFCLLVSGCAGSGRFVAPPQKTSAAYELRERIAEAIAAQQGLYQSGCPEHRIKDARIIRMQGLITLEEWVVSACGEEIIYDVQINQQQHAGASQQFTVTRRF